jgi:Heavy metal binding domain
MCNLLKKTQQRPSPRVARHSEGLSSRLSRRAYVGLLLGSSIATAFQQPRPSDAPPPRDWVCPMDPDVRSDKPGVCPRCGMKLVLSVPDRVEYPLELSHSPALLRPGQPVTITLRVLDPKTGRAIRSFQIVHEKLMHLFLVSENLEFFAHDHPVQQPDGCFTLTTKLPYGGMYRLLADYYPSGSVPQLAVNTLFVSGESEPAKLAPSLAPSKAANLTASLRLEPEQPIAGLETKLFFSLNPAEGLEPYLGTAGHMLAASADLIDLLHLHPFLVNAQDIQFNVIFPRPGLYRVWTQFQRKGVVNTVVFTVPVKEL